MNKEISFVYALIIIALFATMCTLAVYVAINEKINSIDQNITSRM